VLGSDYSTEIDTSDLLQNRAGKPWSLLGALSARLVAADETEESRRSVLNQNFVKHLTGGGRQIQERKYEQPVAMHSPSTIIVMSNSMPSTASADNAFWDSRILVIPWGSQSHIGHEDFTLRDRLRERRHQESIAAWLVRGAMLYYKLGKRLPPRPQAVRDAISECRGYSDQVGTWLSDATVVHADGSVWLSSLYTSYVDWCNANGERIENGESKYLRKRLDERGFKMVRTTNSASAAMDYRLSGLSLRSEMAAADRRTAARPWSAAEAESAESLVARYAPPDMGFGADGAFNGRPAK
jgi:phage/plasmid-associated DNA primase